MKGKAFIVGFLAMPHWIQIALKAWAHDRKGHRIICLTPSEVRNIPDYKNILNSMGIAATFKFQDEDRDERDGEKFFHYVVDFKEI